MKYFIAGCGLTGAVIAERIANVLNEPVTIFEIRDHIGGNCSSFIEPATGIECHRYGSHIFHISDKKSIQYISRFCVLNNYRHRVLAQHSGGVYPMPVNLFTINKFYDKEFTPAEAREFLDLEIAKSGITFPSNLEDRAVSMIGRPLYEGFIYGYTLKQWGKKPSELPADILKRLDFRTSYDCDYFTSPFQGVPLEGYDKLFRAILANPLIEIYLNSDFLEIYSNLPQDATIIYTGMPDELFAYMHGKLEWRSLRFEWEILPVADYQGLAVMNFVDMDAPYTRIHEYKHFHPERKIIFHAPKTVICREIPIGQTGRDEAFYPINDDMNNRIYEKYRDEASERGIILAGRLGKYRYIDMGEAIRDGLEIFEQKILRSKA